MGYSLSYIRSFSKYRTREDEHTRQKNIDTYHGCFYISKNIENFVAKYITNKNIIIKDFKLYPTLKSVDESLHEFQEESKKEEELNKPVQLLKDEEIQI